MTERFNLDETVQILKPKTEVPAKVLIVDDDELVREHLKELVVAAGFEARTVASGAAALAALHKDFAPILITDCDMPDMNGITLVQTVRQEWFPGYVYILILTVKDSEDDILVGLDAGADDYLSKKASTAQLVARLRTARRILTLEHALKEAIQEKQQLAAIDALTGLHNRRYFVRHLTRELKRVRRFGGPLSVLLLDIDHFKSVNDRYGHAIGDQVLQEFSARLTAGLPRDTDWCARLGGEEFIVVLPQTNLAGAEIVGEKLRNRIGTTPMPTASGNLEVTVSIGVSGIEVVPDLASATVESLVEIADRCLYRSKQEGRNRVSLPKLSEDRLPHSPTAQRRH